jgi:2-methylcitrate dehydratase PrpD
MNLCLYDWAACAIAGLNEDVVRCLQPEGEGGAQVFGRFPMSAPNAALINGTMGHALDYDDTHFDHIGHTSAVIMPAVIAMAQDQVLDGTSRVLDAAMVGSEAAVRVGKWLGRDHYQVGFHQTATAGAFGATVALARLLQMDRAEIHHAIGLTATMASGLKGQFGTMGKPLNAGLAARVAIESVTWAKAGMTSDPRGLDDFAATHHGQMDETAWDDEEPWVINRISHKFHSCCHGLHAALEALETLRVDADDIASIAIATHPRWMTVCNQPSPDSGLGVKFSYRHTAAMAVHGISTAKIDNYSDAVARDPLLVAFRDKVNVTADGNLSEMQARVQVTLNDGSGLSEEHDLNAPLTLEVREARLRDKAGMLIGSAKATALWAALEARDLNAIFDAAE